MANKKELVNLIAEKSGLLKKNAELALETIMDVIGETLENGESITLSGFGKFEVVARAARVGTNPNTGEKIKIAATNAPKFRPSKNLKELVK
jgi:DNA-binding protein HU-beta